MADVTLNVTSNDLNDVVNKADKSLSNLTTEGKSNCVKLSFPSNNKITAVVGNSGSFYEAPANGYLTLRGTSTAGVSGAALKLIIMPTSKTEEKDAIYFASWISVTAGNAGGITVPISKGQHAKYVYTVPSVELTFVYAQGEI